MTLRASLVLVLTAPIAVAQCSGPVGSPTGPSSIGTASTQVSLAGAALDAVPGDVSDAPRYDMAPFAKDVTGLAGDWKGDVTLTEQDGDIFRFKIDMTIAELGAGVYQATVDGGTLTLTQNGPAGLYDAVLLTGETKTCDGTAVVYTGSASLSGKRLDISVQGISDDCTLEIVDVFLKLK